MAQTRILIVEDEPVMGLNIQSRLEVMGYAVTALATTKEDALRQAALTRPDLVLMDIQLQAEMDGIEAAEEIGAQFDLPVVYLTASDDDATLQRARISEPFGYLLKPFSARELHTTIEVALYKHQAEAERRQLESQLHQAQRLEAIGVLAGGVAHDFNNILGTILGYTELLLTQYLLEPPVRTYLQHVQQAGERGADLVRQILAFSRSREHHLQPLDIGPLAKEALNMMRATLPATIDIRQQIPAPCPPILADATQIHQVIVNLCVNAGHAMQQSGGTLDVTLTPVHLAEEQAQSLQLPEGEYLQLSVSDTGCGMPAEVLEHAFEPFFTTKATGEGSGMGLSVVHGIVSAHKGAITVDTAPGEGATFNVVFPVTEQRQSAASTEVPEPVQPGKGNLLVIEDEPALAELYKMALTNAGYQVTTYYNGAEALQHVYRYPRQFDAVITDQSMPKMTGVQLSEAILGLQPRMPIILTTGYSETVSQQEAGSLGIRHFLRKPIKLRTLLQVVQQTLSENQEPRMHTNTHE